MSLDSRSCHSSNVPTVRLTGVLEPTTEYLSLLWSLEMAMWAIVPKTSQELFWSVINDKSLWQFHSHPQIVSLSLSRISYWFSLNLHSQGAGQCRAPCKMLVPDDPMSGSLFITPQASLIWQTVFIMLYVIPGSSSHPMVYGNSPTGHLSSVCCSVECKHQRQGLGGLSHICIQSTT